MLLKIISWLAGSAFILLVVVCLLSILALRHFNARGRKVDDIFREALERKTSGRSVTHE